MTTLIVPLKLRPTSDVGVYEDWVRDRDLPIVRGLPSIDSFDLHKVAFTLDGAETPYDYVEVIVINDMTQFWLDIQIPEMKKVAFELRTFIEPTAFMFGEVLV
jgi:hypothetical protein